MSAATGPGWGGAATYRQIRRRGSLLTGQIRAGVHCLPSQTRDRDGLTGQIRGWDPLPTGQIRGGLCCLSGQIVSGVRCFRSD